MRRILRTIAALGCFSATSAIDNTQQEQHQQQQQKKHPQNEQDPRELQNIPDAKSLFTDSFEPGFEHSMELSPDLTFHWNDPASNSLTCRLVHKSTWGDKPSWLGFGVHDTKGGVDIPGSVSDLSSAKAGSEWVIGTVLEGGSVQKYEWSGENVGSAAPMEGGRQTLKNARITSDEARTVMTFRKDLSDGEDIPLVKTGTNVLLFAVGPSIDGENGQVGSELGREISSGIFTVNFDEVSRASNGDESSPGVGNGNNGVSSTGESDGASPTGGKEDNEVNACSSEDPSYLHMIQLTDKLSFYYDLDVWSEVSPPSITVKLVYDGEGWLGFGFSQEGKMLGGQAIIGRPDLAKADEEKPLKYHLSSKTVGGVLPMEEAMQSLKDASIIQENGKTIMTFTKILSENGELKIEPSADMHFIYAIGSGNVLALHDKRGSFQLNLSKCASPASLSKGEGALSRSGVWALHGIIAALAWAVATPAAVTTAWFRTLVPSSWIYIHVFSNVTSFLLTTIAFFIAIGTMSTEKNHRHFSQSHHFLGLFMMIMVLLQVVNGFLRPPVERRDPYVIGQSPHGNMAPPRTPRETWKIGHRVMGVFLLALGFYQLSSGMDLYSVNFGTNSLSTLFYVYLILFATVLVGLKGWMSYEDKKARRIQMDVAMGQQKMGNGPVPQGVDPSAELVPVQFSVE